MEDQSARSKVDRSASRRHVRVRCSTNVTAIFPRLCCRKAMQQTDDHLRPCSVPLDQYLPFPTPLRRVVVIVVGPGIGLPGPILFLRAEGGLRPHDQFTPDSRGFAALPNSARSGTTPDIQPHARRTLKARHQATASGWGRSSGEGLRVEF